MQNTKVDDQNKPQGNSKLSTTQAESLVSTDRPILRRERTFDLESSTSIVNKELKALKKQNRKSMPVHLTVPVIDSSNVEKEKVGWMVEDSKISSGKEIPTSADPR